MQTMRERFTAEHRMCEQPHSSARGWMDGRTDRQTDRWTNGWMDGWQIEMDE